MKRLMMLTTIVLAVSASAFAGAHGLLSREPASDSNEGWERQSYPVGCGHFGANVFGLVGDERVQVTHNALLIPYPRWAKKSALTDGLEIRLRTGHTNETAYARGLDLDRAVAWTEYAAGGVRYRREVFASYPDKVLVLRLTADRKGALAFTLAPYAPFLQPVGRDNFGRTVGRTAETHVEKVGGESRSTAVGLPLVLEIYQELAGFGIRCAADFRIDTDGRVTAAGKTLAVADATTATVLMSIDTNYRLAPETFATKDWTKKLPPTDPRPAARATLAAAAAKGYDALLKRHVDDHGALFGRVDIDLGAAETLNDFVSASQFVAAKGEYLSRYEGQISERAKKVILRMFQDGPSGVSSGLSAAKWIRMTKVSKPTATRDLEELVKTGAIIREGDSVATRYRLNFTVEPLNEPINEPPFEPINGPISEPIEGISEALNEPLCEPLFETIKSRPGISRAELIMRIGKSRATVARAIAALVKAGRVEHRGSKKTGGYWTK